MSPRSSTTLHNSSANDREIKDTPLKSSVIFPLTPSITERIILALERDLMSFPIKFEILNVCSICFYLKYSVPTLAEASFSEVGILPRRSFRFSIRIFSHSQSHCNRPLSFRQGFQHSCQHDNNTPTGYCFHAITLLMPRWICHGIFATQNQV